MASPLELDLFDGKMDPSWGINNTIGDWTPLQERVTKLFLQFRSPVIRRRELYRAGYLRGEIGANERVKVQANTVGLCLAGVEKPRLIVQLRGIFNASGNGASPWRMDNVIEVVRMINGGADVSEVASFIQISESTIEGKFKALRDAGFVVRPTA